MEFTGAKGDCLESGRDPGFGSYEIGIPGLEERQ